MIYLTKMYIGTRKSPKGPNLTKAKTVSIDLSGTKISLMLPDSNTRVPKSLAVNGHSLFNKGEHSIALDIDKLQYDSEPASRRFFGEDFYLRSYSFNGLPILDGRIGGLSLKVKGVFDRKAGICSNFYDIILSDLDATYALNENKLFFKWLYPLDWQLLEINGINFMHYKVQDLVALKVGSVRTISKLILPISPVFKLEVNTELEVARNSGCLSVAQDLTKHIFESIHVEYSEKHFSEVQSAQLKEKFSPEKPRIWDEFKPVRGVDYAILDQYK